MKVYTIDENHPGITDEEVLRIAFENLAVLITQDKDFGELSFRMAKPHHGIVLIRLSGTSSAQKSEIILSVIKEHEQELLSAFTVVLKDYVKIRKG